MGSSLIQRRIEMAKVVNHKDGMMTVTLEFTANTEDLIAMFEAFAFQTMGHGNVLVDGVLVPIDTTKLTDQQLVDVVENYFWEHVSGVAKNHVAQKQMQEAQATISAATKDMFKRTPKEPIKPPETPKP
jgi:hypothetical protein